MDKKEMLTGYLTQRMTNQANRKDSGWTILVGDKPEHIPACEPLQLKLAVQILPGLESNWKDESKRRRFLCIKALRYADEMITIYNQYDELIEAIKKDEELKAKELQEKRSKQEEENKALPGDAGI